MLMTPLALAIDRVLQCKLDAICFHISQDLQVDDKIGCALDLRKLALLRSLEIACADVLELQPEMDGSQADLLHQRASFRVILLARSPRAALLPAGSTHAEEYRQAGAANLRQD